LGVRSRDRLIVLSNVSKTLDGFLFLRVIVSPIVQSEKEA